MKTSELIYYPLRASQVVLRTTLLFHTLMLLMWASLTLVKPFGYVDAPSPVGFNAISHVGFWFCIEFATLTVGFMAIPFELGLIEENTDMAVTFKRTREFVLFWMVLLVFAVAANIVHIVASAIELSKCASTFCLMNRGFLIAFIVLLGLVILMELFELWYSYKYRQRLKVSADIVVLSNNKAKRF